MPSFSKCSTLFPHDYDRIHSIGKIVRNITKENIRQSGNTHQTTIISILIASQLLCSQPPTVWHSVWSQQEIHKNQTCCMEPSVFKTSRNNVFCLQGLVQFHFSLSSSAVILINTFHQQNCILNVKPCGFAHTHEHTERCLPLSPQYFPVAQSV